ncbi:MAG: peptidoglycan DD-metalloendopeptidase family protein [Paracoccaceae bacterium]
MTSLGFGHTARALLAGAAILPVAGCSGGGPFGGGQQRALVVQTAPRPEPDARGVITYPTYQVVVARDGDSVASIAGRLGIQADALGRRNGLPVDYRPRGGELLALPQNVGGTLAGTDTRWTPELAASAIEQSGAAAGTPFSGGSGPQGAVEPMRHTVRAGETAFSIARKYNVSVTALASWNGLDQKLSVRAGQVLLIPVPAARRTAAAAATAEVTTTTIAEAPGTGSSVTPPPSAVKPLPKDIKPATPPEPADLGQFRTASSGGQFLAPVPGNIVKPYSQGRGSARNPGVDFAATKGTTVKAADAGEIWIITKTETLGDIVVIRHRDNLLTVYGRVSGITVKKGQKVKRGQKIAIVAGGRNPSLHFEVRRGTEAIDPMPFL